MAFIELVPAIFINAQQFGADPTGMIDSTTFIQDAINATSLPAVVFLPYGNYIISASLIIDRPSVTLLGEGGDFNTQITIASTADPAYALIVGNTASANFTIIKGLTFKGRKNATTTGAGIHFRGARSSIKQCYVEQFGGSGIVVEGLGGNINDVYMEDVYIEQCGFNPSTNGDGLDILSTNFDSEYVRVIVAGNSSKNTTRDGINNNGSNQKFIACHSYFCGRYGFNHLGGPFEMIGGASETNANDNMQINGVNDFNVTGMQFYGGTTHKDLAILGGTRGTINACRLTSSTTDKNVFIGNTSQLVNFSDNITQNGSNGVQVDATSTRINVHDNQIQSSGDVLIAGTNCDIHDNILTSCGISEQTGANNNNIHHNTLFTGGKTITKIGANTIIRNNQGFVTEAHGNASIASGNTSVVVTHGLALASSLEQISVTPQSSFGSAANFWISNPTSTTFTINLNVDPSMTVTFGWKAESGY